MDHEVKNTINFFWIGPKVSPLEILCFNSCLKQRMTPVLWSYETIENLPQGVIVKDANIILSRKKIDYYLHDLKLPIPNVSDIFRYELLYQIGGIYSDTDIIFISNLYEIDFEEYFCSTFEYNYNECASNCLIKIKKGSIIGKYLVDEANERLTAYINNPERNIEYCEFGPFVAQKCAKELDVKVLTFDVINPISWRFAHKLIAYNKFDIKFYVKQLVRFCLPFLYETRGYFITKNTIAIHLCHETWKGNGIDKYTSLNKLSLFERLKRSVQ